MSSGSDVLVIGSGSVGASTAYHLAARGLAVTIVDQFDVATQASPQAAGLSTTVSRDASYAPLTRQSAEKLVGLEEEIGHGVRFERSGTIRLTRDAQLVANVRDEIQYGNRQRIAVEGIDKKRASALAPFLDPEPALAMTYAPDEIYLPDPGEVARAYVAGARDLGADVVTGARVDSFSVGDGRVSAAKSAGRSFGADALVLAANAGNGPLTAQLGIDLPTVPLRHQLAITEPLADVLPEHPQVKVVDGHLYVRPHGSSLLIGGFEPDPVLLSQEEAGSADVRRLRLDSTPLERLLAGVADVLPTAASASLAEVRGGIVSMTADGHYILDRLPGFENAWIAGGDNAGANTTCPMIGQVIAEWIVDGAPSLDLSPFAVERFGEMTRGEATRLAVDQYVEMIALD